MLLYVVRHGETNFNAAGRIQGQANPELSEKGLRQSRALADALAELALEALYVSPLERALQTARPIAARTGLPLRIDDRLMEIHAGVFQGLDWQEIGERYPEHAARWRSHDPDWQIPGGESRRDLMRRGEAAFRAIRESGVRRAAVIAHGGLISAAFKALLGIPAEKNPFALFNGALNVLAWEGQVKLLALNQVEHLRRAGDDLVGHLGDL